MAKHRSDSEPSLWDLPSDGGDEGPPPLPGSSGSSSGGGDVVPLHEAAQARYLNYALSVITSRALPDVRDGLKPVQRRILFTMWQQNLTADVKHRKCAKVVGDVMGGFHPHGDMAIYETLVRMAQSFSLRYPLVDGSGNFGSLDGDSAAAMRYTECRLARISDELLSEIDQDTVPFRPNYDGTKTEPVVLPARLPNLLVNGATGIAVGMATSIPPHNLGEVCQALLKLLDNPDLSTAQLCRWVKGPDFPTGGQILNSADEIKEIYRTGSGAVRVRGTWQLGDATRAGQTMFITSVPYMVNKATLVERIAEVVIERKLPPLVDVRDVSTDDVRIELTIKKDVDPKLVMAYLCKHTPLQTSVPVNLTCLVPTENPEVGRPERLDLHQILWYFLKFRLDVVTARLEHELGALEKRIHILEGFEKVFDALDEILRLIRKSEGKADAAAQIMKRFSLDAEQTDAILELKIYRLARLEILVITSELADKRKRARQIAGLLRNEQDRWSVVRGELEHLLKTYGDPKKDKRRTTLASDADEVESLGRRLHRRGGQRRDRVARRVGEAPEGSEGPFDDPPARGRLGPGGAGRQHACHGSLLLQLRRGLHVPCHRRAGQHGLRRADSEVVQVQGRRAGRRRAQPRLTCGDEDRDPQGRRGAARARAGRHQRRLQPAVWPRRLPRAQHACGPQVRQGRRRRRGGGRREDLRQRRSSSPPRGRRARCYAGPTRSTFSRDRAAA